MSLSAFVKPMFFKDCAIKDLELNGDYETWANDVGEYFAISGFGKYFASIIRYELPVLLLGAVALEEKQQADMEALHAQVMAQGRYVIYSSLGPTIKREVAKERFKTTSILDYG